MSSTDNHGSPPGSVRAYTVPRRFGMGTILMAVTLFSLLAGTARVLGMPPAALGIVALFIVFVGLAQMLQPNAPRLASAAVGVGFAMCWAAIGLYASHWYFTQFVWFGLFGALVGYLAGTLLAALYLVEDYVHRGLRRFKAAREDRAARK